MTDPDGRMAYAPISIGELVDKVSILEIKLARIPDEGKKAHVRAEHRLLHDLMLQNGITPDSQTYRRLLAVNEGLWDLENRIRIKEKLEAFDEEFIEIARGIYRLNDRRHDLKRTLDLELGSPLVGEKDYGDTR